MTNLTMRPSPLDVFKGIRFRSTYPVKYTGHLIYLREFYKGYNVSDGDSLDKSLIASLENHFEKVSTIYSNELFFNEQLTQALHLTHGGASKDIEITVFPVGDHSTLMSLYNNGLLNSKIRVIKLRATFWFNDNDPKLLYVPKNININLSIDEIDKLIPTLKYI